MKRIGARSGAIGSQRVRQVGQAVAYLGVPLSLVAGPTIESILSILICAFIVAAFGAVAVFRGAKVPDLILRVGYVFLGWYAVLLAIELINGDLTRYPRPISSDFLTTYFILLIFPFFAIGLRELRTERRVFEWVITATIVVAALRSVFGFFVLHEIRPNGFNNLNSLTFAMIVLLWSLFLLAGALGTNKPDWRRLLAPLIALVPIVLCGSKLVWICAALGYGGLFLWWAVIGRRWISLAVTTAISLVAGTAVYQAPFVQSRVAQIVDDVGAFLATGDTTGGSFGIRLAAAVSGFYAFLDRPILGYGLADFKIAALAHRPESFADFSYLWHLHNQYVTHLVAFGIPGLLFLLSFFGVFVYVGWNTKDVQVKRFGWVVPLVFAAYMGAELLFPRSPLYGSLFYLLGICLLATTDDARNPLNTIAAATPAARAA